MAWNHRVVQPLQMKPLALAYLVLRIPKSLYNNLNLNEKIFTFIANYIEPGLTNLSLLITKIEWGGGIVRLIPQ